MENEISLKEYLKIIRNRYKTVLIFLFVVVTVVTIKTFSDKPVYQGTALILIEKVNPKVVAIEEVMKLDTSDKDYYQTQYKILKSRSLAEKVMSAVGNNPVVESDGKDPIEKFLEALEVEPVAGSRLVKLKVEGDKPDIAAKTANAWANIYIEQNLAEKVGTSTQAVGWLSSRVEELQDKVQKSEMALQKYQEENNIIAIEEKQNIVVQKLAELNSAVIDANRKRISVETRYKQVSEMSKDKKSLESITAITQNELIQRLKGELVALEKEMVQLSSTYKEKHPKMIQITSQVELIQDRIKDEVDKIVRSIRNEYEVALAEENTLRNALEEQKKEALDLNRNAIQYNALKRESEGNRKLLEVLLNRMKETSVTEELQFNNIRIIDYAQVPTKPVRPQKLFNLLMALVFGGLGGIFLAFFIEYMDDTVKEDEVESLLGISCLGTIPVKEDEGELPAKTAIRSRISEAFRGLRTAILFSSPSDASLKTIMVTSSVASEGKTSVISNLAVTMAQGGQRVLIVDCDMRKPRIHSVFGLPNDLGLSNLLVDKGVDINKVIRRTDTENLYVIVCGPIPPNPSELLHSQRMATLIKHLQENFDRVLFDSPPLLSVTDASILGLMVDGTLVVVDSMKTSREAVMKGKKVLADVNTKILGIALNKVEYKDKGYYYYKDEYKTEA